MPRLRSTWSSRSRNYWVDGRESPFSGEDDGGDHSGVPHPLTTRGRIEYRVSGLDRLPQYIAGTPDGVDKIRLAQRLAQVTDEHLHDVRIVRATPDVGVNRLGGQHLARVAQEKLQEVVLLVGEVNEASGPFHLMRLRVHRHVREAQLRLLRR